MAASYELFSSQLTKVDVRDLDALSYGAELLLKVYDGDEIPPYHQAYAWLGQFTKHTAAEFASLSTSRERALLARKAARSLMTYYDIDYCDPAYDTKTPTLQNGNHLQFVYNNDSNRLLCVTYSRTGDQLISANLPLTLEEIDETTMSVKIHRPGGKHLHINPLSTDDERTIEKVEYFQTLQRLYQDGIPPDFTTELPQAQAA